VGHGPHVAQPTEVYGGAPIFYSLGNLVFDDASPAGRPQAPAIVRFRFADGGWFAEAPGFAGAAAP